jgi:hypothetical protein
MLGVILLAYLSLARNKYKFKAIKFVGSHGLGVIFIGEIPTGKCFDLFQISENGDAVQIQGTFGSISDDVIETFRIRDCAVV